MWANPHKQPASEGHRLLGEGYRMMGLVADPSGSLGHVQAGSMAMGSAIGACTLLNLPSIQQLLSSNAVPSSSFSLSSIHARATNMSSFCCL